MNIRLAFAGSSGTGKTTLATAIAQKYGLEMCPVGSRSVALSMGFASPYDVDEAGEREEFQRRLLAEKTAWEEAQATSHPEEFGASIEYTDFVTDRTHLDNLAYTLCHQPRLGHDAEFVGRIERAMRRYTHIVFCPVSAWIDLAGDPARHAELEYHQKYENILLDLFRKHLTGAPILWLTTSDRGSRAAQVERFVAPTREAENRLSMSGHRTGDIWRCRRGRATEQMTVLEVESNGLTMGSGHLWTLAELEAEGWERQEPNRSKS